MRNERLLDLFAAVLAVLGVALLLVPVSVSWDASLAVGPVRATAACGAPVRAAFGAGIEDGFDQVEGAGGGLPGELPAGVALEDVEAAAHDAAVNACRGTAAVYLLLGVACLAGALGWAVLRRYRANAPKRAAREAAWRAANPLGEERPLVRPGEVDWDDHDESFDVARPGDFEGVFLGDEPALPAASGEGFDLGERAAAGGVEPAEPDPGEPAERDPGAAAGEVPDGPPPD